MSTAADPPSGPVIVRRARSEELDDAGRLTAEAYELYRQHIPDAYWEPYAADLADARARAGKGTVLVAEHEGRLVGSASILPHDDDPEGTAHLRMLAVSAPARRMGVGRALMDATIEHARSSGARCLMWNTVSFMEPARGLYAELGYEADPDPVELAPGVLLYTYRMAL